MKNRNSLRFIEKSQAAEKLKKIEGEMILEYNQEVIFWDLNKAVIKILHQDNKTLTDFANVLKVSEDRLDFLLNNRLNIGNMGDKMRYSLHNLTKVSMDEINKIIEESKYSMDDLIKKEAEKEGPSYKWQELYPRG